MRQLTMVAAASALLILGGCGRGEERAGQPSAEEAEKLDNLAGKTESQDGTDVFDTSADSKVPANVVVAEPGPGAATENAAGAPAANAQVAAPAGNQAAPN